MHDESLASEWHYGLRLEQDGHFQCAAYFEKKNMQLGIPVVILSTVAGTTVFATLQTSTELWVKVGVGLFTMAAAVLSALQTFFKHAELSQLHKHAAAEYGFLRREFEAAVYSCKGVGTLPADFLKSFAERWDKLDEDSPAIPQSIFDKVAGLLNERDKKSTPS